MIKSEMLDLVPGDYVKCLKEVKFDSLSFQHFIGQVLEVSEINQYYFKHPANHEFYEKVKVEK